MSRFLRAAAVTVVIGVVACGEPPLKEGTVVAKSIDPEHVTMSTSCISYGKYGCNAWIPITIVDDEDYLLRLRGKRDGKTVEQWREVHPDFWAQVNEGQEVRL